ncbi:MAG: ion transporter [Marinifilaceae bacterium]
MLKKRLNFLLDNGWKILVILAVSYQAMIIPLDLLFALRNHEWYQGLDLLVTLIFILDLLQNINRYRKIKRHAFYKDIYWDTYSAKGYFVSDILAVLPYAFLFAHPGLQLLRMFKWVKVLRTFRFYQIRHVRQSNRITLWFLMFALFHFGHLFTCLWLGIHGMEPGLSPIDNYVQSFYWTMTTLTSVGYGDIIPKGNVEMMYTVFLEVIGFAAFAFLVGNIVSIFSRKDPAQQRFLENMEKLKALIHYRDIPVELERRISDFYTYEWKQKLGYDENSLLDSLPRGLRQELELEFRKRAIKNIPIFEGVDDNFVREVAQHLTPLVLTPGDVLFRAEEEAHSMFFVQRGVLKVFARDEKRVLTQLHEGDFLGEIAIFKHSARTATVKAISYADLYELDRTEFERAMEKYPDIAERIMQKSKTREDRYI